MTKIKNANLQFSVTVTVECTEPEAFTSNEEFQKEDAKAMEQYIAECLRESLAGKWQYAARVRKVTVKRG